MTTSLHAALLSREMVAGRTDARTERRAQQSVDRLIEEEPVNDVTLPVPQTWRIADPRCYSTSQGNLPDATALLALLEERAVMAAVHQRSYELLLEDVREHLKNVDKHVAALAETPPDEYQLTKTEFAHHQCMRAGVEKCDALRESVLALKESKCVWCNESFFDPASEYRKEWYEMKSLKDIPLRLSEIAPKPIGVVCTDCSKPLLHVSCMISYMHQIQDERMKIHEHLETLLGIRQRALEAATIEDYNRLSERFHAFLYQHSTNTSACFAYQGAYLQYDGDGDGDPHVAFRDVPARCPFCRSETGCKKLLSSGVITSETMETYRWHPVGYPYRYDRGYWRAGENELDMSRRDFGECVPTTPLSVNRAAFTPEEGLASDSDIEYYFADSDNDSDGSNDDEPPPPQSPPPAPPTPEASVSPTPAPMTVNATSENQREQ